MAIKRRPPIPDAVLESVAQRFRLLGEPLRLRILHALEAGELCVGDLRAATGTSQPNLSKHLAALFQGGLVSRRREGNNVLYAIADPVVFVLCEQVCRAQSRDHASRATAMRKASFTFAEK